MVIFLDWWRNYYFAIRQILFTIPGLVFSISCGISCIPGLFSRKDIGKKLQTACIILIVLLGIGAMLWSDKKEQADWKGLSQYLKSQVAADDLVATPHIE